jgi:hypothetical protein
MTFYIVKTSSYSARHRKLGFNDDIHLTCTSQAFPKPGYHLAKAKFANSVLLVNLSLLCLSALVPNLRCLAGIHSKWPRKQGMLIQTQGPWDFQLAFYLRRVNA